MAGTFTPHDPLRCGHYAHFASQLDRRLFDVIYWILFLLVLFMLFVSSWYWAKCSDAVDKYSAHSPEHRKYMRRCLLVCGFCFLVAATANMMEVYTLLALQFCDGEDLMALYWSTWTTLQLGSCIAICGIALSVIHSYRGRKHPPWGLALGTPVLVIAGFAHFVHHTLKKRLIAKDPEKDTLPMSQAVTQNTLVDDGSTMSASGEECGRVVGFGHDGGPILLLNQEQQIMPPCARLLGTDKDGRYIIAYSRNSAQVEFIAEGSRTAEPIQDAGGTSDGTGGHRTDMGNEENVV